MSDKIFRRKTQEDRTKKEKNHNNRVRNVVMNFRVTPTEKELIDKRIELSGLSKSDFFIQSCMNQKVYVQGNIKTFEAIKLSIRSLLGEYENTIRLDELTHEERETFRMILELLNGIYLNENDD